MNRITRMLTISGLGLMTALTVGVGPVMAASDTGQAATQSGAKASASDRDRIVRYYDSRRSCEFAGRIGERFGRWDDYYCFRSGGFYDGSWVLVASWDGWDNGGPWFHDGFGSWDDNSPWHSNGGWNNGGGHWNGGGNNWNNGNGSGNNDWNNGNNHWHHGNGDNPRPWPPRDLPGVPAPAPGLPGAPPPPKP